MIVVLNSKSLSEVAWNNGRVPGWRMRRYLCVPKRGKKKLSHVDEVLVLRLRFQLRTAC